MRRAAALCAREGAEAVVVFDPTPQRVDAVPGVTVTIAEVGSDADEIIRRLVDASAMPGDIVVVSSDKPLYSYARTRGARVLRAHEWTRLVREASSP